MAAAPATPDKPKSMQELLDASSASDWRTLDPANTLYLELATGRVVIELAPDFAPAHVANIRTLAHEHYWDGLSINRSQDNFVVQWGDPGRGRRAAQVAGQRETTSARGVHPFKRRTALRPPARRRWLGAAGRLQQRLPRRA